MIGRGTAQGPRQISRTGTELGEINGIGGEDFVIPAPVTSQENCRFFPLAASNNPYYRSLRAGFRPWPFDTYPARPPMQQDAGEDQPAAQDPGRCQLLTDHGGARPRRP